MHRLLLTLLLVGSLAGSALAADVQPASGHSVNVPALDSITLEKWRQKRSYYVQALNSRISVEGVMKSYLGWAKESGPVKGQKDVRSLGNAEYGLKAVIKAGQDNAKTTVTIPGMDDAMQELATASETLLPLMKEGYSYYSRKEYTEDSLAKGVELHAKLMPAYADFVDAGNRLSLLEESLNDGLETQTLAYIEKSHGHKYYWYHTLLMSKARRVINAIPTDRSAPVLAAFNATIKDFNASLKEFETYYETAGEAAVRKERMMGFTPKSFDAFLSKSRQFALDVADEKKPATTLQMNAKGLVGTYNSLITSSNTTRFAR